MPSSDFAAPARLRTSRVLLTATLSGVLALAGTVAFGSPNIETAAGNLGKSSPAASADCKPSLFQPPSSLAYADTSWPSEHADAWRTHAAPTGLPRNLGQTTQQGTPLKLQTSVAKLPPVPVWGYVGKGSNVYVVGGAPYLLDMYTELMQGAPASKINLLGALSKKYATSMTPYIARINTKTMKTTILSLPLGTSANYTGGALVHANGFLYTVARSVLYKIDTATFQIVASKLLPLAPDSSGQPNEQTAYNGMVATKSGDLIMKGWASTGGGDLPPGILLRIDPTDLSTKTEVVTTAVSSPRMAIVEENGQEYLYFPNTTQSVRFIVGANSFTLDDSWSKTYLAVDSGVTTASSDVYLGSGVVFANNTELTATTPMSIFSQGAATTSPLQSIQAFSSNGAAWSFFMMAADPYKSGVAVMLDQNSGHVAGYLTCGGGQSTQKLWENDSIKASSGVAINYKAGHLYTDDRKCTGKTCRLFLVVLDLKTGVEIARTAVKGDKPSMGQIFIGANAVYYVASNTRESNGYVTRVTASR